MRVCGTPRERLPHARRAAGPSPPTTTTVPHKVLASAGYRVEIQNLPAGRPPPLTANIHTKSTNVEAQRISRGVFFFGKTVFLLTNNLHGRTRRRRENTKAEARGAKGAAARHARPTHAGAGRDVGLRGRRWRSPKRRGGRSGYSWKATRVAPTPQGCMWTRLGARHRGHLLFASRCMAASQPRQTACGQCQRHGGARECATRVGHGELNVSMYTEQSSPSHSGSGGAAGTHPRGRPPGLSLIHI